ncbi:MAG: Crp/Fnr family transcriptional regulator [Dehalococcoidales bacterium]|jgi:CRP/FNR family transcriptional regulator|nr:Crp/Fnr family transcriptional regulator [Dehalococcoidales bacterium]
MQDIINLLKRVPIFSSLSENELAELSAFVRECRFAAGDYIFWEGDSPEWFYLVAEGKIKISKLASTGKETIIAFFGPGEMFGEAAVFENKPYPASAQAVSPSRLLGIKRASLLEFLGKYPEIVLKITGILAGRLRDAQNRLRDLAGERVEQRLARILLMLSARLGNELPFTRQEISDMAGTTTETTIRVFSQWKERNLIDSQRGKIVILDENKIKLLAEGPPHP